MRDRVQELAETVIANLDKVGLEHPVAEAVAALIRKNCEIVRTRFRN